jgi:signal transduction histidine kinase
VPEPEIPSKKPSKADEKAGGRDVQKDQQIDRIALLAHQLMTPLSTISTLAQGLMRRTSRLSTDDIQERSEKIWRASLRLQELIETIMSYTRINAGGITPNLNLFNLDNLVRRICQECRRQEPDRPFNIELHGISDIYVGDPILLEQAFVILLSNAMKYSDVHQSISVISRKQDGKIAIEIRDEGIGVSVRDLPYLMQPFFRGRNAKHIVGTGLGLSLASHILTLHGGNLQIESKEGCGTTVTVILPDELTSDFGADI